MKVHSKKVICISLICAVALLVGCVFSIAEIADKKAGNDNLYEQILAEDGFIFGMNYPWIQIGHTLTGNEVMKRFNITDDGDPMRVGLDVYGDEYVYEGLYNLRALGYSSIGYWGSTYGEGVIYDEYGDVLGVKEEYLTNIARYLEICRRADMTVLWILQAHNDALISYFGEKGKRAWDFCSQAIVNPDVSDNYIEKFIRPVQQVLAQYPDVVALISASSEAENEINDDALGDKFATDRGVYGTTEEKMVSFMRKLTDAAAEECPDIARTLVCNTSWMNKYNDFDLTVIGKNRYSSNSGVDDIESLHTVFPAIISEWGIGDLKTEEHFTLATMTMQENIEKKGYKGAYWWSYVAGDTGGGSMSVFKKNAGSQSDFRPLMYSMYYHIKDYINAYRGVEEVLDVPAMFYNRGSGMVEWIASRQATSYDVQRSMDGGATWVTLAEALPPEQALDESREKGVYMDETLPEAGNIMYRVVAHDDDGNTAISEPSNENAIIPPAPELTVNGNFEDGENGWDFFMGDSSYVSNEYASEGEYSVCLTGGAWEGIIQENIPVEGGKRYKVTYKYLKDPSITTVTSAAFYINWDENDGSGDRHSPHQMTAGWMNSMDEGWQTYETTFVVPKDVNFVAFDLRVGSPDSQGGVRTKVYIDEISLKEVR
ncbi:MAG: carbohydrate binding domain-containing protein [Clostridia bacterium]|nr:carbohydrate binding domain-containing protein [Clostridia bacterium]